VFPDLGRRFALNLENSAVTALPDRHADPADATVTIERSVLNRLVLRETTFADAVAAGVVRVDGAADRVAELFGLLDDFTLMFPVVEPRP